MLDEPPGTFAVMDRSVPTKDRHLPILDETARAQFEAGESNRFYSLELMAH